MIGEGALLMECAEILLDRGHGIVAIVSSESKVADWARKRNIECVLPTGDIFAVAKAQPFDYLFSIVNYSVLPDELLAMAREGAINYHDAPLPRYAGLHATSWALLAREPSHAVTWHRMSEEVDGGDIYEQKIVEISAQETAFTLNSKCYAAAIEAFRELAEELGENRAKAIPQDFTKRTYFGKYDRPESACVLDWNKSASDLEALVRALDFGVYPNPLGSATLICGGEAFVVSKANAVKLAEGNPVGTITEIGSERIVVATSSGALEVRQLLQTNGTAISVRDFTDRFKLKQGDRLPTFTAEKLSSLNSLNARACRHEVFWAKRLTDLQPCIVPLARRAKSSSRDHEYRSIPISLSDETLKSLQRNRQQFSTLLTTAFGAFLSRINSQSLFDLAVEVEDLEADSESDLFSRLVPMRVDVDFARDSTFALSAMESELALVRKHFTYRRDLIARSPQLRSSASAPQSYALPAVVLFAQFTPVTNLSPGTELALSASTETGNVEWIYDATVLDPETVERAAKWFTIFLESFLAKPAKSLGTLPILSDAEWNEVVPEPKSTVSIHSQSAIPTDGSATLHQLLEMQAAIRPDSVALICDGESLTYRQVNAQANRLARKLVKQGVKPDVLVGICLERSNAMVIAILAILKAGAAYLPIDLAYPADRLAFMLEDAEAPILLTDTALLKRIPTTRATVMCIDELLSSSDGIDEENNLPPMAGPDNLAYVIYTSGTTGKPKGSLITHRNVVRLFSSTEHWYGFNDTDVWTLFHSSAFDFSVWEIWGALLYGGRLVVVPFLVSRSPESFYELLVKERVTVLNQTPSAFRQLIHAEESIGQQQLSLRYVIFGGEALEMQSLCGWFERHGDQHPRLINMYGITETTVHVTYRPLSKDDLDSGSVIGVPIPDLQVYILDARRQPVPLGIPGEMYVSGAGLARGYLRRDELTAQRFVPNSLHPDSTSRLYKTGDLARALPGGDIEYLGRIDDQVKIRGFRIELGEIESVLAKHPSVREAAVIARQDAPGEKRLVAYLVAANDAEIGDIRDSLKKQIPEYMVPAAFVFLEKLPLTASGKVDRKALPAPAAQRSERAGTFVAPATPVETKLAEIWSSVLRLEKVGIHDNFFELGGDSILGIQIISQGRHAGLKLSPKLLFAHQTIAELAHFAAPSVEVEAVSETLSGQIPLTPIQKWFFEQNLDHSGHYNQAFLLSVAERMDRGNLEQSLQQLSRHHDALRLRFTSKLGAQHQSYDPLHESAPLDWFDYSEVSETEQSQQLESAVASAPSIFDLANGPIWRVTYFDFGSERPGRLLFTVHHLAVDGVSWRSLIQDLETAYQQIKSGQKIQLSQKTTSFKSWADRLQNYATSGRLKEESPYWEAVTRPDGAAESNAILKSEIAEDNLEKSAHTFKVALTVDQTRALIQAVPAVYNTQINDVLLTALARGWQTWSGSDVLFTNMEGHGREHLFDDVDLSRTVGWFTSIFPVRLELPEAGKSWHPGHALKHVKEQLRAVPDHGVGYGILRYLSGDDSLVANSEPAMVFNYLGQFDQVLAGSKMFKFADESTAPWHAPSQHRKHILELNSMVIGDRLEFSWTHGSNLTEESIRNLAHAVQDAVAEIILHCQSTEAGGRTPSDFPKARLDQSLVDKLVGLRRDVEDIYPLSPLQELFFSANPAGMRSAFDQWHYTIDGHLDVPSFQRSWEEALYRHSVLRSTIHSEGLREPVQLVNKEVQLLWVIEDWRDGSAADQVQRWSALLEHDRSQPLSLAASPAMRIRLIQLSENKWKFLWSVPSLLLDGWSWPLVFRDVSLSYKAFSQGQTPKLDPVRSYRDYLDWLEKQNPSEAEVFWRNSLRGFHEPTPLRAVEDGDGSPRNSYGEFQIQLSSESTNRLLSVARERKLTLNSLVQGVWAIVLSQQSGTTDLVFGAAFAGRPTDLPGAESIVGPFANNLPVRAVVDSDATFDSFLQALQTHSLALSQFQFTPLFEIQKLSEVPWQYRLFDSLIVFQNYLVDESAQNLGGGTKIADFAAPIHTNYPVVFLVEPGTQLRMTLIYDGRNVSRHAAEQWGRNLQLLLEQVPVSLDQQVAQLLHLLPPPFPGRKRVSKLRASSQNFVAPQTELERSIADIWQKLFGIERISIEDNFFDLGGHSLLLLQMLHLLRKALKFELPIVTLLEHPSIRLLASHLTQPTAGRQSREQWRERAERQKRVFSKIKKLSKE
jgi:amino acid adenylation domain-containing protein/non-ribosomal peptide synthase protein (TIGR01720 family)